MDTPLVLPLAWKGRELEFPMQIIPSGYSYRFVVLVEGIEVTIERDDAGEFRALISQPQDAHAKLPDHDLLAAIVGVIAGLASW